MPWIPTSLEDDGSRRKLEREGEREIERFRSREREIERERRRGPSGFARTTALLVVALDEDTLCNGDYIHLHILLFLSVGLVGRRTNERERLIVWISIHCMQQTQAVASPLGAVFFSRFEMSLFGRIVNELNSRSTCFSIASA